MSERYIKVFELPKNLYAEEEPVIISAGALLKDNQTGTVLAQLKFKSITNTGIKAAKVSVLGFDTAGNQVGEATQFEYLDLEVSRDEEFGQKVPLKLKYNTIRSFEVTVDEVIFSNNTVWTSKSAKYIPIERQKRLIEGLGDNEVVKQYKIKYGNFCEYGVEEDRDLWFCSCSAVNRKEEEKCHKCQSVRKTLENYDIKQLKEETSERLEKEAAERERKEKLAIKAGVIAVIAIILFSILSSCINSYNEKLEKYNRAVNAVSANPEKAIEMLTELNGFKDSEDLLEQAYEKIYKLAVSKLGSGYVVEAKEKFEFLKDYKDSRELYKETEYQEKLQSGKIDFENEHKVLTKEESAALLPSCEWAIVRAGYINAFYRGKFNEDGTAKIEQSKTRFYNGGWAIEDDGIKLKTFYVDWYPYVLCKISDDVYGILRIGATNTRYECILIKKNSEYGRRILNRAGINY